MRRNLYYQFRRAFASYLLVILQVHLLGVAMLHWHGEVPTLQHGLRVENSALQQSPASDCSVPCTACQIVQSGAARAATVAQIIPSSNSVPLVRSNTPSIYHSEFSAMSYGRAPPLI